MLKMRISSWPENTGLNHVSTTWQISDKSDFTNVMDESIEDSVYVDVFYSNVVVPQGQEYYGRSKRHFENGGVTEWIGPIKLLPPNAGENIDLKPEVVIEEPSVKIIDSIETNEYVLQSGSFRCNSDGHKATNWVLKNGLGTVLFRSIANVDEKRELKISKDDLLIGNSDVLIAEVSYISTNDYESHFGSCKIELGKFGLEVISNTNFIPIHEDYEFKFKVNDKDDSYHLTTYKIEDNEGNLIQDGTFERNEERIILERQLLRAGKTYYISIYSSKLTNDVKVITFYTNRNSLVYRTDKKFKYLEEYLETNMYVDNVKQTIGEQFIDNGIPISIGEDKLVKLFNYDRRLETMTISDLAMIFVEKPVIGNRGTVVKVLDSDRILIDAQTSTTGKNEFRVYDYNYTKLLGTFERPDEEHEVDITNAMDIDNEHKVYYFAKVNGVIKFRMFDPDYLSIKDLSIRPDLVDLSVNLVYIGKGRFMSFAGSGENNLAYIYDISSDSWFDVTLVPEKYRTLKMTSFLRKDGKVASFNTGDDTNDVLIFDPDHNKFTSEVNNLDDTIDLNSTVRLRNGEFLRFNSNEVNSRVYLYR